MRIALVISFVVAVACLGACHSNKESTTAAVSCDLNSDCAAPLVCQLGRCRAECQQSRDCALGLTCVQTPSQISVCQLPEETACERNSDCASLSLQCFAGRCVPDCTSDAQCPTGQHCVIDGDAGTGDISTDAGVGGTCVLDDAVAACDGGSCVPAEYQCPVGGRCANGAVCSREGLCVSCIADNECDLGERCVTGACRMLMFESTFENGVDWTPSVDSRAWSHQGDHLALFATTDAFITTLSAQAPLRSRAGLNVIDLEQEITIEVELSDVSTIDDVNSTREPFLALTMMSGDGYQAQGAPVLYLAPDGLADRFPTCPQPDSPMHLGAGIGLQSCDNPICAAPVVCSDSSTYPQAAFASAQRVTLRASLCKNGLRKDRLQLIETASPAHRILDLEGSAGSVEDLAGNNVSIAVHPTILSTHLEANLYAVRIWEGCF